MILCRSDDEQLQYEYEEILKKQNGGSLTLTAPNHQPAPGNSTTLINVLEKKNAPTENVGGMWKILGLFIVLLGGYYLFNKNEHNDENRVIDILLHENIRDNIKTEFIKTQNQDLKNPIIEHRLVKGDINGGECGNNQEVICEKREKVIYEDSEESESEESQNLDIIPAGITNPQDKLKILDDKIAEKNLRRDKFITKHRVMNYGPDKQNSSVQLKLTKLKEKINRLNDDIEKLQDDKDAIISMIQCEQQQIDDNDHNNEVNSNAQVQRKNNIIPEDIINLQNQLKILDDKINEKNKAQTVTMREYRVLKNDNQQSPDEIKQLEEALNTLGNEINTLQKRKEAIHKLIDEYTAQIKKEQEMYQLPPITTNAKPYNPFDDSDSEDHQQLEHALEDVNQQHQEPKSPLDKKIDMFLEYYTNKNLENQSGQIALLQNQHKEINNDIDRIIETKSKEFQYPAIIVIILKEITRTIINSQTDHIDHDNVYYDMFMSPNPSPTQQAACKLFTRSGVNDYVINNWEKIYNIVADQAMGARKIHQQIQEENNKMIENTSYKTLALNKIKKEQDINHLIDNYGNQLLVYPHKYMDHNDQYISPLQKRLNSITIDSNSGMACIKDIYSLTSQGNYKFNMSVDLPQIQQELSKDDINKFKLYAFIVVHIQIWELIDDKRQYDNLSKEDLIYAKIQSLQCIEQNSQQIIQEIIKESEANSQDEQNELEEVLRHFMNALKKKIVDDINELNN